MNQNIPTDIDNVPLKEGDFYLDTKNNHPYYLLSYNSQFALAESQGKVCHPALYDVVKSWKRIPDIKEYISQSEQEIAWLKQKLSNLEKTALKHQPTLNAQNNPESKGLPNSINISTIRPTRELSDPTQLSGVEPIFNTIYDRRPITPQPRSIGKIIPGNSNEWYSDGNFEG